jgi:hypothetical protein
LEREVTSKTVSQEPDDAPGNCRGNLTEEEAIAVHPALTDKSVMTAILAELPSVDLTDPALAHLIV